MQITKPTFCNEFSCIAGSCPDTCCAGWQIMIDQNSLKKYRHCKGAFRNRLLNDIDWKEHSFRHYQKRCAFLNEDNLCDIYSEAGKDMLCDTCRKYPRHIEEFEGLRELSLSLSCPEAARIFLSHKEKITFRTVEKETPEETYDDFDYFLFTALMDTRDYLFSVIQDRKIHPKEGSYTNYLFDKGIDKILKKVGEEATEIVIAAKNPDSEEIKYEISDFLYHVMVLMAERGVTWEDITEELANR